MLSIFTGVSPWKWEKLGELDRGGTCPGPRGCVGFATLDGKGGEVNAESATSSVSKLALDVQNSNTLRAQQSAHGRTPSLLIKTL